MKFFKEPSYLLIVFLAIIYFFCGFALGYYSGYFSGQDDYLFYLNKMFENN